MEPEITQQNSMTADSSHHTTIPPLVRVGGTHYEIGYQIGQACKQQILHSIENARMLLEAAYHDLELSWDGAQIQARKYLPFAQERYPKYMDELNGIADGADLACEEIAVVNAMEGVAVDALHLTKCTSLAVNDDRTSDGHILLAHNEDWLPEDEQDVYIVHASPEDEPAFLGMTYGALLPNIGFNSAGIAQLCDTVYPSDSRIGIPRVIVSRAVLGARSMAEAIRYVLVPQRAAGYNHVLVDENGEMYSVEVSARKFALLYGQDGYIVHTNHYLDAKMQAIELEPDELIGTRLRYFRATRLIKRFEKHTIKTLETIQRDHLNYPNSICNHYTDSIVPLDREKTISAMIIDLTARALHIAWGNPCTNDYHTYYL